MTKRGQQQPMTMLQNLREREKIITCLTTLKGGNQPIASCLGDGMAFGERVLVNMWVSSQDTGVFALYYWDYSENMSSGKGGDAFKLEQYCI